MSRSCCRKVFWGTIWNGRVNISTHSHTMVGMSMTNQCIYLQLVQLQSINCRVKADRFRLLFFLSLDQTGDEDHLRERFAIYMTNTVVAKNLKFIASRGTMISESEAPDLFRFTLAFSGCCLVLYSVPAFC